LSVVDAVSVLSGVRRFMVGRSGSSAEVLPVDVVDGVDAVVVVSVPEEALSGVRRFMVGRSGSSAGAEPVSAGVLDAVVDVLEPDVSEVRRFMVGRSGSALVEGLVVLDAVVVSGLLFVVSFVWLVPGLLGSLAVEDAVSPGFEPKCGRFGSAVVVRTGSVFDGFNAAAFRAADRGFTLP
jgi:hypothetical protein